MNKPKTSEKPLNINKKKAPENKDNIDSRSQEEFDFKGNDITHNKKEGRSERVKVKNNMGR